MNDVLERLRAEAGPSPEYEVLLTAAPDGLAASLTSAGLPLWARELAAYRLGLAGDRRAFESLVLLLNHRDPAAARPPPRRWPSWTTRAPPARRRPWPPTACARPTPCSPYGCSPPCAPPSPYRP